MKYWREAATVILAARSAAANQSRKSLSQPATQTGRPDIEDYKVLMLKRSGKSSFMPSRMVFPGGTVSGVDHSTGWHDLFSKMTNASLLETMKRLRVSGPRAPMVSEERPEWPGMPPDITFRISGVREVFEESGLLLALSSEELFEVLSSNENGLLSIKQWTESEQLELERWRKLVNSDANAFLKMCTELELFPNIWALHEWNNWLTPVLGKTEKPEKKPLRFDTMFYICCFECDRLPNTSADEAETVSSQWKRPSEFLSLSTDHNLTIDIPQGYELRRLLNFPSIQQLNKFSAERGSKGLIRCMPVIQSCQDGFIAAYPGDWRYPENPDFEGTTDDIRSLSLTTNQLKNETKSHRLVFDRTHMQYSFICNIPLPCGQVIPLEKHHLASKL